MLLFFLYLFNKALLQAHSFVLTIYFPVINCRLSVYCLYSCCTILVQSVYRQYTDSVQTIWPWYSLAMM